MNKKTSLHLADRPADDLLAAMMAFVTPPLAAIFAERSRQGQSPDILAEAICIRIKRLAQGRVQQSGSDSGSDVRDPQWPDRRSSPGAPQWRRPHGAHAPQRRARVPGGNPCEIWEECRHA